MRIIFLAVLGVALPAALLTAAPPAPQVSINLGSRDAKAWPTRKGFTHTGGGNIDVQQPSPDALQITLTGVAVAGAVPTCKSVAQLGFEVTQEFEVSFDDPKVKRAKLSVEGRITGLLRSHKGGGVAASGDGCASILAGEQTLASICTQAHSVNDGISFSVNDRVGPKAVPVAAGSLTLHQNWCISATHPMTVWPYKAASAEFAPDPALDPLWISYWEPFHGASKKDFGFQIIVRVSPDVDPELIAPKR
jgi:hypothetical protein